MSTGPRTASRAAKKPREDWPLVVYVGMIGVGFLSYLVLRLALDAYPHPVHWSGALGGAVLGGALGWLWYRRRGDIV